MNKLTNAMGWVLGSMGVVFLLLAVLTIFDKSKVQQDARFGFVMFGIMFGVPGAVLRWRVYKQEKEETFRQQLLGYIKNLDSFTTEELARKINRSEMETEALVATLSQREELDLVFHKKTRQYLHKKRLRPTDRVLSRCPSCNAALSAQLVFEGEEATCPYCANVLLGHGG